MNAEKMQERMEAKLGDKMGAKAEKMAKQIEVDGFVPVSDKEYDIVREILKAFPETRESH